MKRKPFAIILICVMSVIKGLESIYYLFALGFLPWVPVHISRIINNTPTERGVFFEYIALVSTIIPVVLIMVVAALFLWAAASAYRLKGRTLNIVAAALGLMSSVKFLPYAFAADLRSETAFGIVSVKVITPLFVFYFIWAICYLARAGCFADTKKQPCV